MTTPGSARDLLKFLEAIDHKIDPSAFEWDGGNVWPYFKIQLFFENWIPLQSSGKSTQAPRSRHKLREILSGALPVLRWLTSFNRGHVALLGSSLNRRMKVDGKAFEVYMDPFYMLSGSRACVLERPVAGSYFTEKAYSPSIQLSVFFGIAALIRLILARFTSLGIPEARRIAQLADRVSDSPWGMHSISESRARQNLLYLLSVRWTFSWVFRWLGVRSLIVSNWYGSHVMGLIHAARSLKIHTVDVQHGVQAGHLAYSDWNCLSKSTLPPCMPEEFWVWSDADQANLRRWTQNTGAHSFSTKVIGNPLFELIASETLKPDGEAALKAIQERFEKRSPGAPQVLITLQPYYPIETFSEIVGALGNCHLWIRLHPSMLHEKTAVEASIQKLGWPSFDLETSSNTPLPLLLSQVDLHITYNSSVVIDGAFYGVPSWILDLEKGEQMYPLQIERDIARLWTKDLDPRFLKASGHTHSGNWEVTRKNLEYLLRS